MTLKHKYTYKLIPWEVFSEIADTISGLCWVNDNFDKSLTSVCDMFDVLALYQDGLPMDEISDYEIEQLNCPVNRINNVIKFLEVLKNMNFAFKPVKNKEINILITYLKNGLK